MLRAQRAILGVDLVDGPDPMIFAGDIFVLGADRDVKGGRRRRVEAHARVESEKASAGAYCDCRRQ